MDSYIRLTTSKDMWDALEGVSDAGSELYILEEFLDYRMLKTFCGRIDPLNKYTSKTSQNL